MLVQTPESTGQVKRSKESVFTSADYLESTGKPQSMRRCKLYLKASRSKQ
jgi:hypothetical protein